MSRPTRRLLRAAAPVVLTVAALVTASACDSSQPPQSREHSTVDGVNEQVGQVLVRNATITIDPGGVTGSLLVALLNQSTGSDALTAVSSPQATLTLPTSSVAAGTAPAIAISSGGAVLAPGAAVFLNSAPGTIAITALTRPLAVGDRLPVTMTFAAAGSITLEVPVTQTALPQPGSLETASPVASQAGAEIDGETSSSPPSSPAP